METSDFFLIWPIKMECLKRLSPLGWSIYWSDIRAMCFLFQLYHRSEHPWQMSSPFPSVFCKVSNCYLPCKLLMRGLGKKCWGRALLLHGSMQPLIKRLKKRCALYQQMSQNMQIPLVLPPVLTIYGSMIQGKLKLFPKDAECFLREVSLLANDIILRQIFGCILSTWNHELL